MLKLGQKGVTYFIEEKKRARKKDAELCLQGQITTTREANSIVRIKSTSLLPDKCPLKPPIRLC